jgi:hypothetical protein
MQFIDGALMVGQVAWMMTNSAIDMCQNEDTLKNSIVEMQSKIEEYNKTYKDIIDGVQILDAQTKGKIDVLIDDITNLNKLIAKDKKNFQDRYRTSQILGVTFCATVCFIFICKIFGVDKIVHEVLLSPFIWIKNFIMNK